MNIVSAIIITWIVSPAAYWVLTRIYRVNRTFPISIKGAIGDTVFLPVFNGLVVYFDILTVITSNKMFFLLSVFVTVIFSIVYFVYRKDISKQDGWMRSKKGKFNFVGWYHFIYVVLQLFIIVISLLHFYESVWLWLVLLGYASTAIIPTFSLGGKIRL